MQQQPFEQQAMQGYETYNAQPLRRSARLRQLLEPHDTNRVESNPLQQRLAARRAHATHRRPCTSNETQPLIAEAKEMWEMSEQRQSSSQGTPSGSAAQSGTARRHPLTDAQIVAVVCERQERRRLQLASVSTSPIDTTTDSTPGASPPDTATPPSPGSASVVPDTLPAPPLPGRVVLAPDPDGILEFPSTLVTKMWNVYPLRSDPAGTTWRKVSQEIKDWYWGEFHKVATWAPEHESLVKKEWLKKNVLRYKDYTLDVRTGKKPFPADPVTAEKWHEEWNSPAFKEKQKRAKLNRRGGSESNPALPTHTSGCRTHRATHKHLAKLKKRSIQLAELHEYCHTRKHEKDKWIVPKSKEFQEDFEAVTQSQGLTEDLDEATVQDLDRIFYQVVGGHNKKKLVYGVGSLARSIPQPLPGTQTSTPAQLSGPDIVQMQKQLIDVITTVQKISQRQDTIEKEIKRIRGSAHDRSPHPDDDGLGGNFGL